MGKELDMGELNVGFLKKMTGLNDKEFEERYVHKIEPHHFKFFEVRLLKDVPIDFDGNFVPKGTLTKASVMPNGFTYLHEPGSEVVVINSNAIEGIDFERI